MSLERKRLSLNKTGGYKNYNKLFGGGPYSAYPVHYKMIEDIHADLDTVEGALEKAQGQIDEIEVSGSGGSYIEYYEGTTDYFEQIQTALNNHSKVVIGTNRAEIFTISQPLRPNDNQKIEINGTLKIQDSLESPLLEDMAGGSSSFRVANPEYFAVGQYVAITDDTQSNNSYKILYGTSGVILSIEGDLITFDAAANALISSSPFVWGGDYLVSQNARCTYAQGCIILEDKSNIHIYGSGVVDGNRDGQTTTAVGLDNQIHPIRNFPTPIEDQKAATSFVSFNSSNVQIDDIEIINGLMHSGSFVSYDLDNKPEKYRINNVKFLNGHDKSCLVRIVKDIKFVNCETSGATFEDGLMFYSGVEDAMVLNHTSKNNQRYGIGWPSILNFNLQINGYYTEGNYEYGLHITANTVNASNLIMKDCLRIINASTYTVRNINISNLTFIDVNTDNNIQTNILSIRGAVENINLSNLNFYNCKGTGISSDEYLGDTANYVNIIGGGIYNHTGTKLDIHLDADFEFIAFRETDHPLVSESLNIFTELDEATMALISDNGNWTDKVYSGPLIVGLNQGNIVEDDNYIYMVTSNTLVRITKT